jgi:hypothetical protein
VCLSDSAQVLARNSSPNAMISRGAHHDVRLTSTYTQPSMRSTSRKFRCATTYEACAIFFILAKFTVGGLDATSEHPNGFLYCCPPYLLSRIFVLASRANGRYVFAHQLDTRAWICGTRAHFLVADVDQQLRKSPPERKQ